MKRIVLIAIALLLSLLAQAQDRTSSGFGLDPADARARSRLKARMQAIKEKEGRPTVALVFSGGGAKGAATVGALKFIEQYNLPVDMVLGTSIGGLIGGLYAIGYDVDYLDSLIRNMDWDLALSDKVSTDFIPYSRQQYKEKFALSIPFYYSQDEMARQRASEESPFRSNRDGLLDLSASGGDATSLIGQNIMGSLPSGLVYGQNVNHVITSKTVGYSDSLDFFQLPIPFACVATDVASGRAKVWHSGSLNMALRSTMSIPGLFTPVRTKGMVLVDGGMRNNFPVDLASDLGADIIIGIDLSTSSKSAAEIQNLGDILWQGMDMLSNDSFKRSLEKVTVYIHPDLEGYNLLSFNKTAIDTMLVRGYQAAAEKADQLARVKKAMGKAHFKRKGKPAVDIGLQPVRIDSVEVVGVSAKDADYIRSKMLVRGGGLVDFRSLENDIATIFGNGSFDFVNYELRGTEEPYRLRVMCKRGPKHQFGAGFRIDSEDLVSILINVGLNAHAMQGHSLDLTTKIGVNPYMDLLYSYRSPKMPVLNARAKLRWTDRNTFISGTNHFNITFLLASQELFISNLHWSNLDLKLGLRNDYYNIHSFMASDVIGDYDPNSASRDYPGAFIQGRLETLDNSYFPTKGASAGIRYDLISRVFDPGHPMFFGVLNLDGMMPVTWDRFTLVPQGALRFIFGDDIPLVYANAIGGDFRGHYVEQQLPFIGIDNAAFRRNYLLLGRMDARYRVGKNSYLSLMYNVSYDFFNFPQFEYGEWVWGVGTGYAYNTIVGPLKATLHYSSLTRKVGLYLSLGFNF